MPDILHRVAFRASPQAAYKALTARHDLATWWTTDTRGASTVGEVIHFQFGDKGFFDMKVLELEPARRVLWQVVDGPKEWIGTRVRFELSRDGDYTTLLFTHEGWKEPVEFMYHCSTKWAVFLMSLKSLLETGKGAPFPDDVKIDNWN
jgi:uncharacterized protein YndB with AHSA1/START domain